MFSFYFARIKLLYEKAIVEEKIFFNTLMWGLLNAKCRHSLARGRGNRGIIYDIGIGNTLGGNYEYWKNSFIKFTVLQKLDVF